jgi:ATP-dependent Clp protease protease subunit
LQADDARTEQILRQHVRLSEDHWRTHEYSDLHLTASEGLKVGMITQVRDFVPPSGERVTNI